MYRPYSRANTLLRALIVASIAASWPAMLVLPMLLLAPSLILIPLIAFAIAFGLGLVLGLPLYLVLEQRGLANGWLAALAGIGIGIVPALILTLISYFQISPEFRPQHDVAGWLAQASGLLWIFGFLGLCGGSAFFAVASGAGPAEG